MITEFYPTNNMKDYFVTSYYRPYEDEAVNGGELLDIETIGMAVIKTQEISPKLLKGVYRLENWYLEFINNAGCRYMRFETNTGFVDISYYSGTSDNRILISFMDKKFKPLPHTEKLITLFIVFVEKLRILDELSAGDDEIWVTWGETSWDSSLLLTTRKM